MTTHVHRSISELIRTGTSFEQRWRGPDRGLITCWEVGRALRKSDAKLAACAQAGELPVLGWKGGIEKKIKAKKFGSLNYLAQLQALRGQDLDIDTTRDYELACSRTGMTVTYTADKSKWSQS